VHFGAVFFKKKKKKHSEARVKVNPFIANASFLMKARDSEDFAVERGRPPILSPVGSEAH